MANRLRSVGARKFVGYFYSYCANGARSVSVVRRAMNFNSPQGYERMAIAFKRQRCVVNRKLPAISGIQPWHLFSQTPNHLIHCARQSAFCNFRTAVLFTL